ncbi:EthD family reductase [Zavarzinia aquatilis]|uniref:EthD family reductase n=1 Tax=Zavarzinia aquatilis TaxID=2211142 RepID=A0A317DZD2_9PROT|nr:EthD family reductase [Zavarzinia aquatilis]PWR19236.1 EthD family reductase [Zavarzinia aquatilis]
MATLLVLYGRPSDPAAFDRHYAERHLPLVRKLPGLRGVTLSAGVEVLSGDDLYRVVRLEFPTAEAVKAALGSAEGLAAAADLANFADGGIQIVAFDEVAA